ncbi:hypothetical protein BDW22DRAFT_1350623 [Trametopsis cervina]|nr:hypothetical protein BDW22DRAFT_1350623 [Trametopsis cervina]
MSAPSFSSFAPSFSSFPDLGAPQAGPSKEKDTSRSGKKEHGRKRGESERSRNDRKSDDRANEPDGRDQAKHKYRDQGQGLERDEYVKELEDLQIRRAALEYVDSKPLFYSDRKGDILNVKYGRLHAGDIPKYSIIGRGRRILGLGDGLFVLHRGRQGLEVGVAGSRRRLPTLTDSSSRHVLRAPPTKRLVNIPGDAYKYIEVDGFLRLPSRPSPRTPQTGRDISTVASALQESESESGEYEYEESDDSDTTHLTSRQATLRSLEAELSVDPTSIPTWLALLSHTLSSIPPETKNADKSRAEIALAVLSRALSAHPSNAQSQRLRLKYLNIGEAMWTAETLHSEWEKALKIGSPELWIQWLDWRIRAVPRGIEGVSEDARRVLAALSLENEDGRLRAFWRIAIALRDAGFIERANALFQAQAELIFQKPSDLRSSSLEEQLDRLEEFWDSEVPRLGEVNASGWATWESASKPEAKGSDGRPAIVKSADADPYVRWARNEQSSSQAACSMPTRTFGDNLDEDPYSTVLFSDIRYLLLDLRSSQAKESFRLIWLSFLGVHIPGLSGYLHTESVPNTDERWCATHFASPGFLSSIFPTDANARLIAADAQAGVLLGHERQYSSTFGPVKNWTFDAFAPLEGIGGDQYTMLTTQDLSGTDIDVIRQVFQQCRTPSADVAWDILHLAFEGALNPKSAIKVSKLRLASVQDSLYHWAAHARLERLRGRPDEARKVYSTVLPSAALETAGSAVLWWDWAELEWQSNSTEATILVILRSTATKGSGTVAILRSKRRLDELYQSCSLSQWKERQAWLRLRVLLEMLTASVESAVSILDVEISRLNDGTLVHETLTMTSLLMLYVHGSILRNPLPPALLRDRAERAIGQYPSNTVVLGLFLESEKGQAVWGKVRLMLGETTVAGVAREKDLPRRVAEVWAAGWERGRWKAEEERVRASLSSAARDERTRASAILWRVYLEFEIRAGQLRKAKKLLFRAIGECPLVKELYILAFIQLRSVFSTRELTGLAETMAERGIRLREGLDEALEGWQGNVRGIGGAYDDGEDYGEEEIEHNADELRRLKPY